MEPLQYRPSMTLKKREAFLASLLLQPVKTQFIDEENVGCGILFEPSMKAVVGLAGKKVREHIGRGGVPASVELFAANE